MAGDQLAVGGAILAVRGARCVVCRWTARIPLYDPGLDIYPGRQLPRTLGDWLWHHSGRGAADPSTARDVPVGQVARARDTGSRY